jgi:hypothetical protein
MAKFVEDVVADELAGIQPTKPAATATAAAPAKVATAAIGEAVGEEVDTPSTAPVKGDVEDVEFGDEELMKETGLRKLLPPKGTTDKVRASIIGDALGNPILVNVKPKKGYSHWIKGKGTFACHSVRDKHGNIVEEAICCTDCKEPAELSVACLAVHYTNVPKDGKYVIVKGEDGKARYKDPVAFDIKWVKLSRQGFQTLSGLPPEELARSWSNENPTVYDIDFTFAWKNAESGGGYNYAYAGKARWRSDPKVQAEVFEAIKPYLDGKRLKAKLGKQTTLLELKAALSGASGDTTEEAELGNIDNL